MLNKILIILLFLKTITLQANTTENKDVIVKFNQLRGKILQATTQTPQLSCEKMINDRSTCSFEQMCSRVKTQDNSLYLLEDSSGHRVNNIPLLTRLSYSEFCLTGKRGSDLVSDPFLFPRQFTDVNQAGSRQTLLKNQQTMTAATARMKTLFAEIKQRVIMVLKSRMNAQNSAQIENMIQRIQRVRYTPFPVGGSYADLVDYGCEQPNAAYKALTATVIICPQFMNYPESSLYTLIAHELGHAIDPCSATFHINQQDSITPVWDPKGRPAAGVVINSLPVKNNPFSSVIACLQSDKSIQVKVPTREETIAQVRKQRSAVQNPNSSNGKIMLNIYDEKLRVLNSHYEEAKNCRQITSNGHMQEAFSDWIASQVIAKKVTEISKLSEPKAEEFALGLSGAPLSMGCSDVRKAVEATQASIFKGTKCEKSILSDQNKAGESNSHPMFSRRVNKIYLSSPEIAKALGCRPNASIKECF